MPKKPTSKKNRSSQREKTIISNEKNARSNFFEMLKIGESYTSLILGVIVVIVTTALLLSFIHAKNTNSQLVNQSAEIAKQNSEVSVSGVITPTVKLSPTVTSLPTPTIAKKTPPTPTSHPTLSPKRGNNEKVVENKFTSSLIKGNKKYTVIIGDTLWNISEKVYKNGYQWVVIARANNLNDPNIIQAGNQLVIPPPDASIAKATEQLVSAQKIVDPPAQTISVNNKITGKTYVIEKGDNLWDIAVRAYGDGYQWVKIASANSLANPGIIHSGNTLQIPR